MESSISTLSANPKSITPDTGEREREMGRSPCCSKEWLNRGAWTTMEDKILSEYIKVHGEGKWKSLPKRAGFSFFFFYVYMCVNIYIKKIAKRIKWAETVCYIKFAGLKRCGKSCRQRWLNYLRPDIKRGNITRDEEELIIRLHNLLGNRSSISSNSLYI